MPKAPAFVRSAAPCTTDLQISDIKDRLRERIRRIEGRPLPHMDDRRTVIRLDGGTIDAALPWRGLPAGCLHEINHPQPARALSAALNAHMGAATGFCALLLARFAHLGGGAVLWCRRRTKHGDETLYGPGLIPFGLDPDRVILVRGTDDKEILWAMEEGLRAPNLAAVLGEVRKPSLTATRRLQLAAETGGAAALLLRPEPKDMASTNLPPSTALSRWSVRAEYSSKTLNWNANPLWKLDLMRCRGSGADRARQWIVAHDVTRIGQDETGDLRVVHDLRHRPHPQDQRATG